MGALLLALACAPPQAQAQLNYFSDFNDGIPDWDNTGPIGTAEETSGQLSIRAQFPGTPGDPAFSATWVTWRRNHPIRDAETLEYGVDLVQTSQSNVFAGFDYNATGISGEGLYTFIKDANNIQLTKYIPSSGAEGHFFFEATPVKHQNVTMSMALTGVGGSVWITCRVLDKDAAGAVLFERTIVDTPGIDPVVVGSDTGPPFGLAGSTGALLYSGQITDGTQPETVVIYDNFTWEYRSAAELSIERAVRLSWPAFDTVFDVEGAPSPDGPWTPISEPIAQTNGMNWMTVPAPTSQTMQIFRLSESMP